MTQVHVTVALNLDTGVDADREVLARLLATPSVALPAVAVVPPEAPAAKPAVRKTKTDTSVTGVLGPPEDTSNGLDHDDDMGLDPDAASLSPTEAKDQGL